MKRQTLVPLAVVAAVLAAWWMLLWSPQTEALESARSDKTAAEQQQSELELRLARLAAAKAEAADSAEELAALEAAVPEDAALPEFLLAVDEAAERAGATFVAVSPQPPQLPPTGGAVALVNASIQVEGGYRSVLAFLDELMAMDRVVLVDDISVTPQEENGDPALVVALGVSLFTTQVPAGATPPAAAPAPAPGGTQP